MKKLVLFYKRLHEELRGEYPYEGRLVLFTEGESKGQEVICFIQMVFKDIVALLHKVLNEHTDIKVVLFQRTEREDILPMQLAPDLIRLIRDNPLDAYRTMSYNPHPVVGDTVIRVLSQETARQVGKFGEIVYLDMKNGYVLDPITGDWRGLAYGEKQGWRINAGDNKSDGWLPIDLIDDAPAGTQLAFRMAFARWASISVQALLDSKAERFFLNRVWNTNGPWISRGDLEWLLQQHRACKEA